MDIDDPGFWETGLTLLRDMVDQAEGLAAGLDAGLAADLDPSHSSD